MTDAFLDETRAQWEALARRIWETPELALHETRSSRAFAEALEREGFKLRWGVGGMKTAFVATAGSGQP